MPLSGPDRDLVPKVLRFGEERDKWNKRGELLQAKNFLVTNGADVAFNK